MARELYSDIQTEQSWRHYQQMPAVSKAQSRFLNAKFGHAWVKEHHFDNSTHGLPAYKAPKKRHVLKHVYGLK